MPSEFDFRIAWPQLCHSSRDRVFVLLAQFSLSAQALPTSALPIKAKMRVHPQVLKHADTFLQGPYIKS